MNTPIKNEGPSVSEYEILANTPGIEYEILANTPGIGGIGPTGPTGPAGAIEQIDWSTIYARVLGNRYQICDRAVMHIAMVDNRVEADRIVDEIKRLQTALSDQSKSQLGLSSTQSDFVIDCFIEWLNIRQKFGFRNNIKVGFCNLNADIQHSALLYRLFSGKKALPTPPPVSYSSPWYDLIDNGYAECTVFFPEYMTSKGSKIDKDPGEVVINSNRWTVEQITRKNDVLTHLVVSHDRMPQNCILYIVKIRNSKTVDKEYLEFYQCVLMTPEYAQTKWNSELNDYQL